VLIQYPLREKSAGRRMLKKSVALSDENCLISYIVTVYSEKSDYDAIMDLFLEQTQKLEESVYQGDFTKNLNLEAQEQNCSTLAQATSKEQPLSSIMTAVEVYTSLPTPIPTTLPTLNKPSANPTVSPTHLPTLETLAIPSSSANFAAGIVAMLVVIPSVICAVTALLCFLRKEDKSEMKAADFCEDNNSETRSADTFNGIIQFSESDWTAFKKASVKAHISTTRNPLSTHCGVAAEPVSVQIHGGTSRQRIVQSLGHDDL